MNITEARKLRDAARNAALYGPRNSCSPCGDTYARWCNAHPDDRRAYDEAVAAVRRAISGTRYEGADPEHI